MPLPSGSPWYTVHDAAALTWGTSAALDGPLDGPSARTAIAELPSSAVATAPAMVMRRSGASRDLFRVPCEWWVAISER